MRDFCARHQWLMPVILATQGAEIRRIKIPSKPVSSQDPVWKKPTTKKAQWVGTGGVAQGVGPEFKS
jgi:hypothetical protein